MVVYDHTKNETVTSSDANIGVLRNQIYGDLVSGATLRFVASTLDYKKYVRVGAQQTQMSYNSFMMPYIYLGVGKTSNYFESMTVGVTINGENKMYTNTPIVPKSQLILYANEGET